MNMNKQVVKNIESVVLSSSMALLNENQYFQRKLALEQVNSMVVKIWRTYFTYALSLPKIIYGTFAIFWQFISYVCQNLVSVIYMGSLY